LIYMKLPPVDRRALHFRHRLSFERRLSMAHIVTPIIDDCRRRYATALIPTSPDP